MSVAVVVTVRNEAATIDALLAALAAQRRAPDEVLVVDGGSSDGTAARAAAWAGRLPGLTVLAAPGTNISAGRNHGIRAAGVDLIAVTDAGCAPVPEWLAHLVAPLERDPGLGMVSGVVVPDPATHLEACIGRCSLAFELRVGTARFYPTGRTLAFRRALWERVGGFPEHLDFGEDTAFILAAAASGAGITVAPGAAVRWRPRRSYGEVVRQFYHYADGLARAGLSPAFHLRTAAQSLAGVAALGWGLASRHWLPWSALALLAGAYLVRKARQGCFAVPSWRTGYRVPLVLLAVHAGTMAGVLAGHWHRLRTALG